MIIESIFCVSTLKKDKCITSLVIEIDNAKIANTLIEEEPILDHTLHGYMRYNPACRLMQCFNYYEYGYVLVYCYKNIKRRACLGAHRTLECT